VDRTTITPLANGRVLINIDGRSLTLLDTEEAINSQQLTANE
jgi:hypothetical protein